MRFCFTCSAFLHMPALCGVYTAYYDICDYSQLPTITTGSHLYA